MAEPIQSDLELLEPRIVLSAGIGAGLHLKTAKFHDAAGDSVVIKLIGPKGASFDISLDGGITDGADVESIKINGGDSTTVLSITGGSLEVGLISAPGATALKGISSNGADLDEVDLGGVNLGSLALSGFRGSEQVNLGSVQVGSIGTLSLVGPHDFTNQIAGPIVATGAIAKIVGGNLDLSGSVEADTIGSIRVGSLSGDVETTGASGEISLNIANFTGSLETAGAVDIVNLGAFSGLIDAHGNIAGAAGGNSAIIIHSGGQPSFGVLHTSAGNIADISFRGPGGFSGSIIADTGNIGTLSADHFSGALIDAVTGAIAGINAKTISAGAGISNSTFHAGTTIGSVSATDTELFGAAIRDSVLRADTGFTGTITGNASALGSEGIVDSSFSTGGDFTGVIQAKAGAGQSAFDAVTVSALGSIAGGLHATGSVSDSTFLAGYDIGPNGFLDGSIDPTSDDQVGASSGTTPTIAAIIVTGNIVDSQFIAGVESANGSFGSAGGSQDLINNAAANLASLTVSGAVLDSVFEAGSVFTGGVTLSHTFADNTVAALAGSVGNITLVGAVHGGTAFDENAISATADIGNILVHNKALDGFGAISNLDLNAGGNIGDIVGITDGNGDGIAHSNISAAGSIGSVIGIANKSLPTGPDGNSGINDVTANAGASLGTAISAAATAFVTAEENAAGVTLPASFGGAGIQGFSHGTGSGIQDSTFATGNGSLGKIVGVATGPSAIGITGTNFRAVGGDVGNIVAVGGPGSGGGSALGLVDSVVTTTGNIGTVNVTGEVDSSKILAGVDLGVDFAVGNNTGYYGYYYYIPSDPNADDTVVAGKSIGNVSVSGAFLNSDLIASVDSGGDAFGTDDSGTDSVPLGGGGTIGTVHLLTGGAFTGSISAFDEFGQFSGIEASTIGAVTVGSPTQAVSTTGNGSVIDWFDDGSFLTAVRKIT